MEVSPTSVKLGGSSVSVVKQTTTPVNPPEEPSTVTVNGAPAASEPVIPSSSSAEVPPQQEVKKEEPKPAIETDVLGAVNVPRNVSEAAPLPKEEPKKEEPAPAENQGQEEDLGIDTAEASAEAVDNAEEDDEDIPPPVAENDGVDPAVIESLNDFDLRCSQIPIVDMSHPEELVKLLDKFYPTEKAAETASKDPASFLRLLERANRIGQNNRILRNYVDTIVNNKVEENLRSAKEEGLGDSSTSKLRTKDVDVSGTEARNAFMAAISGLLKVKLLGSGFWVTIRRPQIEELQLVYDCLELSQREIGFELGSHFALCADVFIKRRFIDALIKYRIINGSNLVDIYKEGVFVSALSYNDYETLVHAVLTLMSRGGLRSRIVCPKCHKVYLVEDINIGSCKFVNKNLLTPELKEYWRAKDANGREPKRTLKDVKEYQKKFFGMERTFSQKFNRDGVNVNIDITYKVPSMATYLEDGERLMNKLRDIIDERDPGASERRSILAANVGAHIFKMLIPWVDRIEQKDETGKVIMRTHDKSTIEYVLDTTTQEREHTGESLQPITELESFTAQTRTTYIGMMGLECEKCHAKPNIGLEQFYPLEVQMLFFGQLYRLLPEAITSMGKGNEES